MMYESESNFEQVHADGTVTDKRDGKRRDYATHIAHFLSDPPQADLSRLTPTLADRLAHTLGGRYRLFWREAWPIGAGFLGGLVAFGLTHIHV